jgi:hypothetical protein
MASKGPQLRWSVHLGRLGLPWPSCLFRSVPGTEVDDARKRSWSLWYEELALLGRLAFHSGG